MGLYRDRQGAQEGSDTKAIGAISDFGIVLLRGWMPWELFDADRGKDSAREIREYFIPDFKHVEGP